MSQERDEKIVAMAKAGLTLQQIGDTYGVSRERIRQILARLGVERSQRGKAVCTSANRATKEAQRRLRRDQRAFSSLGCTYDEARRLNDGLGIGKYKKGTKTAAFIRQRINARTRGIDWRLTFPQWCLLWEKSGHWSQRGRGHGRYVMPRIGDSGAYALGNVHIQLADDNNREGFWIAVKRRGGLPSQNARRAA